jgi:hypothetical protein
MSRFVLLLVTLTSVSATLIAQNRGVSGSRGTEIKVSTWQAPAFWDDGSKRGPKKGSELQPLSADSEASATGASRSLAFVAIVPCRLMDTRGVTGETGPFGPPAMAPNEVRTIPVLANARCNIPATARAYSLNFTVVPNGILSYLSAWPSGHRPVPDVSILNSTTGQIIANAAVVPGCGPQASCPFGIPTWID